MSGTCPCCGQPVSTDGLLVSLDGNAASRWGHLLKMRWQEAEVLYLLYSAYPGMVTYERMITQVYGRNEPECAKKVLEAVYSRLRRIMAPLGVTVDVVWGRGVRLSISDTPIAKVVRWDCLRRART
jgi:DNA-binding response OmpR family regulator